MSTSKDMLPRTQRTRRTRRWRSVGVAPLIGMKSTTSPTPSGVRNRVIRIAVSGRYICFELNTSAVGRMRNRPPFA